MLARLLCFALLGSEAGERATQTTPHRPVSREAQSIVRVLEARYHSARTLKAVFLERYHEGGRDVRAESGTVYFSRPGRMRWEYESPEPKLFVADGKTVWFYVPADRTVTRAQMKESADWRTPLALLTGKAKLSSLCSGIEVVPRGEQGLALGRAVESSQPADVVVLRCLPRGETPTVPSLARPTTTSSIPTTSPTRSPSGTSCARRVRSHTPNGWADRGCRPGTRTSLPSPTTSSTSARATSVSCRHPKVKTTRCPAGSRRSRPTRPTTRGPVGCCCRGSRIGGWPSTRS